MQAELKRIQDEKMQLKKEFKEFKASNGAKKPVSRFRWLEH